MTNGTQESYFALVRHLAQLGGHEGATPDVPLRRKTRLLFRGIPLAGRSVLDVGGGNGAMSFYCAAHGARPVVCLEPSADGSNPRMDEEFLGFAAGLGEDAPVELVRETFQALDPADQQYDVILIHNAINHLDEEACRRLPDDVAARAAYRVMFRKLADLAAQGGVLIIADAARKNAWNAIGRRSPFAPTIEWDIHAQPSTWAQIAGEAGWCDGRTIWRSHDRLGRLGQAVLGNRVGGWLTNSNFILQLRRAR